MELAIAVVLFVGMIISWLRLPATNEGQGEAVAAERQVETGHPLRQAA